MTSLFVASLIAYVLAVASIGIGFFALLSGGRDVLPPFATYSGVGLVFLIIALTIQGIDNHLKKITDHLAAIRKASKPPKI